MAEIFATLKEPVEKKRGELEKERFRERAEESRRKFLLAMTEGQACHDKEVLKSCFIVWKKHLEELIKEKTSERRMMALWASDQARLVLNETFGEWHKLARKTHSKWEHARKM